MRLLCVLLLGVSAGACQPGDETASRNRIVGGDPERGRALVERVGCGACHIIPGVRGPRGSVGPSLEQFADRSLLGGQVPNQPTNLVIWVRNAPALVPDTGMPPMPLTEGQARDVAAYLYTLR